MNKPLLCTSLAVVGAAATMTSCSQDQLPKRPNVVYILADDLGYGDTSVYGADKIKTPNIDRLASQGRRFTDAHSASAVSTPSRYALLTGEYPFRGIDPTQKTPGLYGPLSPQAPLIIDTEDLSLPEMMQRSGYKTAAIGKWHLGWGDDVPDWNAPLKPGPNEVGFDYYFGVPLVSSGSPFFYVENSSIVGYDPNDPIYYVDPKSGKPTTPVKEYPTKQPNRYSGGAYAHSLYIDEGCGELLLDKAFSWLDKSKDDPFFLYFASTHIHHPFTPSDRFKGSSEAGIYGDYVQELDWMVGEIMSYLDENGLSDNTLVVFTSDNGGMINYGGQEAFDLGHKINGDLLGYKFGVWEGGHRIPFIVRWPGYVEPATVSDQTICNVDMMATFADVVGYDLQPGDALDSHSVLESWVGEPKAQIRDYLLMSPRSEKHNSLRMGDWLFIPNKGAGGFQGRPWGVHGLGSEAATVHTGQKNSDIVNGRVKKDAPKAQLYNLKTDPYQTTNVIKENPEIAKEMAAKLTEVLSGDHTRQY